MSGRRWLGPAALVGAAALVAAAATLAAAPVASPAEAAGPARDYSVTFRTESGNISCAYEHYSFAPVGLRCEIRTGVLPLPPKPRSCHLAWGAGYFLARSGRPSVLCISDTIADPHARVLAPGSTYRIDVFACAAQASSLRCRNASGHGFVLARRRSPSF